MEFVSFTLVDTLVPLEIFGTPPFVVFVPLTRTVLFEPLTGTTADGIGTTTTGYGGGM